MRASGAVASLIRQVSGIRPGTRHALIAMAIGLAGLALVLAAGDIVGPPTNRDLANALATGG